MKQFTCLLLFTSILFSSQVNAGKVSVTKLRNRISNQGHKLSLLAAQIKDVDSKIGKKNNDYLDKIRAIEQFDQKIIKMKTELGLSAKDISQSYQKAKSALELFLLEKTDDESENSLQERMIYYELLGKKISSLSSAQKESNHLLENINLYEIQLSEMKRNEEFIYRFIVDLENSKKKLSRSYISLMESKNDSQKQFDKIRAKKRVYKSKKKKLSSAKPGQPDFFMSLPLKSFSSVSKSKKGITFKFNETLPISAPKGGKVAYSGELASYGNVIIIDHGKDIRSVFFGDINSKVKKGSLIKTGQLLGYTDASYGEQKSLYYEIRKKNKVQNTYSWFSKNNIKKLKI
jgi:murein DD-endopeptidase MepM/ murein hydrolase activator NlpD